MSEDSVIAFLFTDIEDSTGLSQRFPAGMRAAQARHDDIVRRAAQTFGGGVFRIVGDGFCIAFAEASAALNAAFEAQRAMQTVFVDNTGTVPLRMRAALHAGATEERDGEYYGLAPAKTARLLETIHGGQIILTGDTAPQILARLPEGASLHDLGEHRLRSFQAPDRLYQMLHPDLPARFLPLRPTASVPNNLPRQLTPFIGREKEIGEIRHRVVTSPLVTLSGGGGCGKTRLALQVSDYLLTKFPEGIWFADLARCADGVAIEQSVASAIGATLQPGQEPIEQIAARLKNQSALLIMDNCEHLIDSVTPLILRLLQEAPNLHVLATSRETLNIAGETLYAVHPMPTPPETMRTDAYHLMEYEVVRLFGERAAARNAAFRLTRENVAIVARICRRLEGIPLAVVLTASWADMLTPSDMEKRLKDRFKMARASADRGLQARQKTLRASLDFSYELLTDAEKALLPRLSVFRGGWSWEAAEAVCSDAPVEDVGTALTALARKSIIEVTETLDDESGKRYGLLETIREYAAEKLQSEKKEIRFRDRHRNYFVQWAMDAKPRLIGPQMQEAMQEADSEIDNLRAALNAATATADGLKLIASLYWYWRVRGYVREGIGWAEKFLREDDAAPIADSGLRADARTGTAHLYWASGDLPSANRYFGDALALFRAIDDEKNAMKCLINQGAILADIGETATAAESLREGLNIAEKIGDAAMAAHASGNLGVLAERSGDYNAADGYLVQAITIHRTMGNEFSLSAFLLSRANIAMQRKNLALARATLRECLPIRLRMSFQAGVAEVIDGFAELSEQEEQFELSASLLAAATLSWERAQTARAPHQIVFFAALRERLKIALGENRLAEREQIGREWDIEHIARLVADNDGNEAV